MFPKRIPNYLIASCKTANDVQLLRWPGGQQEVMGIRAEVVYKVPSPDLGATPKYIASNYANAVRDIGGKLLDDPARSTLGDRLTARVEIENSEVWVHLTSDNAVIGGNWLTYKIIVVQKDAAARLGVSLRKLNYMIAVCAKPVWIAARSRICSTCARRSISIGKSSGCRSAARGFCCGKMPSIRRC